MPNKPPQPAGSASDLVLQAQAEFEARLEDPVRRRAWEFVQEGETLFGAKRYDEALERLAKAASLDHEYVAKLDAYRQFRLRETRKGPVKLTKAINRVLWPALSRAGFAAFDGTPGAPWREGQFLVRVGPSGRQGSIILGRGKFGHELCLIVGRQAGPKVEYLPLADVGLPPHSLKYLNQAEAEAVVERVARALGEILAWLDE